MYTGYGTDPMPADKLMKLFIIQSISAFVANDYETGLHFLQEIKQAYAENMGKLNPTLKQVAKEIIQAVDLFNPDQSGGGFLAGSISNYQEQPQGDGSPGMPSMDTQAEEPRSVASELQDLLNRRKAKRNR